MLPSFCNQTVTRIRPTTKNVRGSVVPDWEHASSKEINGVSMQPASTSLSQDGRVLGISDLYTLFAPPDADIQTGDRISFNSKTYTIDGEVRIHPSVLNLEHIEVTLRRYNG